MIHTCSSISTTTKVQYYCLSSLRKVFEAAGSIEYWQCSAGCCRNPQRWKLPHKFNFVVHFETMTAPSIPGRGRFAQLYHNRPLCIHCGQPARPSVQMLDDTTLVVDDESAKRYEFWKVVFLFLMTNLSTSIT